MATRPPTYIRRRPAPDASVVGAPPVEHVARHGEGFLGERARRLDLSEWETLGRHERGFLREILRLFHLGKGATVWSLDAACHRKRSRLPDDTADLLGELVERQAAHVEALEILGGRLDETDGTPPTPGAARSNGLRNVYQALGKYADASASAFSGAALAVSAATIGAFAPTGYRALEAFIERTGSMTALTNLVGALRASDERQFAQIDQHLEQLRNRSDRSLEAFDASIERSLLPYLDLIREFQRGFDFLELGLVPDEFVAYALDRFFELGRDARLDTDLP